MVSSGTYFRKIACDLPPTRTESLQNHILIWLLITTNFLTGERKISFAVMPDEDSQHSSNTELNANEPPPEERKCKFVTAENVTASICCDW